MGKVVESCVNRIAISLAIGMGSVLGLANLLLGLFTAEVKPGHNMANIVIGSIYSLLLPGCLALLYPRVTADRNGLRMRGWRRKRNVPWSEVTDYYDMGRRYGNYLHQFTVIETRDGLPCRVSADWENVQKLRDIVAEYATNAKTRKWGLKGTRDCDTFPRTFGYKTLQNRMGRVKAGIAGLYILAAPLLLVCNLLLSRNNGIYPLWLILSPVIPIVGISGFGILVFRHLHQMASDVVRRRDAGESWIVDRDGFVFVHGAKFERVLWDDVTDYYQKAGMTPTFVVETRQHTFNFTLQIKDFSLLQEMIRTRVNPDQPWRVVGQELRPPVKPSHPGEQIFHYRTRVNRAVLSLLTLLPLMLILVALLQSSSLLRPEPDFGTEAMLVGSGLFLLGGVSIGWLWYRKAYLRVDDAGITQHTMWGRQRFIGWEQVPKLQAGSVTKITYGNGKRLLYLSSLETSNREQLSVEINRHLNPALDSAKIAAAPMQEMRPNILKSRV